MLFFCTDLAEEPHKHGDFSEKYHECGFVAPSDLLTLLAENLCRQRRGQPVGCRRQAHLFPARSAYLVVVI